MRLKVTKSKNAASLYVIKSTYDNGVHSSKVVEKLGTEKELLEKLNGADPYEWAKNYIDKLNQEEKEAKRRVIVEFAPTKRIKKGTQASFNGGYLFLQKIYYSLQLDRICTSIKGRRSFEFDLNQVLSTLVFGRALFPASKLSTLKTSKSFIEPPKIDLQHIYRSLDILDDENDFIQSELYKNSCKVVKRNTGVLFYDCTNFFFEIEQETGDKMYGASKENRPNPIVEMGLFMDGNGIPLAFSIHPGNTNEQVTLKPLEKKILNDFDLSRFVVCTDAGLSSTANRRFNNVKERAFITTQSVKKLKKHLKEWALSPDNWLIESRTGKEDSAKGYNLIDLEEFYNSEERTVEERVLLEDKVFYKERWINEDDLEQRLIVTYSLKYRNYQRKIRKGQIERAQKIIDTNPTKLKKCHANDFKRFIKKQYSTPDGEVAEKEWLSIDEGIIQKEEAFDGFYAVCTNLKDSISNIVKVNKGRWEIEECFRIMKSEFEARPAYVSREARVKGHFMTCFLALIVYRLVEQKLENKYTCYEILETLRNMNFYRIPGEGYVPTYKRTDLTDALHEVFGFRTDYEILNNQELKKILKFTKSK